MRIRYAHPDSRGKLAMREDAKPYRAGPRKGGSQQKQQPTKKAVNLSIDAELLREAKAAGTNLSGVLETALKERLKQQRWQQWREENRAAIEASNAQLERDGLWYEPEWLQK
jgi:antitoxin CcdA